MISLLGRESGLVLPAAALLHSFHLDQEDKAVTIESRDMANMGRRPTTAAKHVIKMITRTPEYVATDTFIVYVITFVLELRLIS